jgi:hypothetical protein
MTRRNAEQFAEWYECSAPIITLDDPHIRSTRTSSVCARRGYKTAIVAVAHRLPRLLYALLRDGTEF